MQRRPNLRPAIFAAAVLLPAAALAAGHFVDSGAAVPNGAWTPVEITNSELRAKGTVTGDGCQWVRAVAVDGSDGNFMLWCTDVGGLFRSLDGGNHWEPANVGFAARGSSAAAIDPNNPKRAIVIAANTVAHRFNGIYVTTDQAASWKHVLPVQMAASHDQRYQLAFDPSTYDSNEGFTRVVYWSRLATDKASWGSPEEKPGLYKSLDGGTTWAAMPGGEVAAEAMLAVAPKSGALFAANLTGLHISRDGGKSWTTGLHGVMTGVAVSAASPDVVFATGTTSGFKSTDGGKTWSELSAVVQLGKGKPEEHVRLQNITAAPSDANRLMLYRQADPYQWKNYFSHDGGATWNQSQQRTGLTIVPYNVRPGLYAFGPKNANQILLPGADHPAISTDGGRNYGLAGNGVNNIFVGGAFNFSAINPDVLFFGSQDYACMLTTDGGTNWKYLEPGNKHWGGYNYGGYASTPETLVVGEAEGWGSPKLRAVSLDGGKVWKVSDQPLESYIGYGDPIDKNVLFSGQYRSADGGKTWSVMNGASGVYVHDAADKSLIGILAAKESKNWRVVRSVDQGVTWQVVCSSETYISDVASDSSRSRVYLVAGNRLRIWESNKFLPDPDLPKDQDGAMHMNSVAVDPVDSAVIYIAGNRNIFASNASALRSTDAGKTWLNLNRQEPLDGQGKDGGREAMWVRVHGKTREPWFATNCYGIWKFSAPAR